MSTVWILFFIWEENVCIPFCRIQHVPNTHIFIWSLFLVLRLLHGSRCCIATSYSTKWMSANPVDKSKLLWASTKYWKDNDQIYGVLISHFPCWQHQGLWRSPYCAHPMPASNKVDTGSLNQNIDQTATRLGGYFPLTNKILHLFFRIPTTGS